MEVFGIKAGKGEKKYGKVCVGQLAHKGEVNIPVMVAAGKEDGPTLWINGAVHGDELNGSQATYEFFKVLNTDDLRGAIICTPISNPSAYLDRDKVTHQDFLDMDTTFPGDPEGLITQRQSYVIYQEIKEKADFIISFHTLNSLYDAQPYTIWKKIAGVSDEITKKANEMALNFGVSTNCFVDLATATGELPGVTSGGLDTTAMKDGIPTIMAEIGGGGRIERKCVEIAKRGIKNVLVYLNMLDGLIAKDSEQYVITKRRYLRADNGGFFNSCAKAGDILKKGEKYGSLHYFGEEVEDLVTDADSFLICMRRNPVVNTGDRTCFVGTEWYKA